MLESFKKIAVIFPGQGAQSVGMLGSLSNQYPIIKEIYSEASDILGYNLWQLAQEGPASKLNQTEFTQPALLTTEFAAWQLCATEQPFEPKFLAGHSLGEYTALVCAKSLEFSDAIKLVAKRGQLMQSAVPAGKGAMAAIIGLNEAKIQEVCNITSQGKVIEPANYNSIGQTVIAGEKEAIERALIAAKEKGAKIAKLLEVSVPSHCKLMKNIAEEFEGILSSINIKSPEIPVINNVDVLCYNTPEKIKNALVRQLYSPVRWVETIQALIVNKVGCTIECGPGKILAGLNKRIDRNLPTLNFSEILKKEEEKS